MPLGDYPLRTQIAVTDIGRAVDFYEGTLGLVPLRSTPSAEIEDGGRIYAVVGEPSLVVYQTTARASDATVATWMVDDIDQVVDELVDHGVELVRYDDLDHDARGITDRAGGGRIAWIADPDGNTFAIEADS